MLRQYISIVGLALFLIASMAPFSGCVSNGNLTPMGQVEEGNGKIHMLFVNGSFMNEIKSNHQTLLQEISNDEFLEKKAIESDNALAPCALLTNAILSVKLISLQSEIVMDKQFPAPGRGTNIFGMYDNEVSDGGFFDQPSAIKADIIARMHIFWSGGFDWQLNDFMYDLTQKQCLDHLLFTDLETLAELVDQPTRSIRYCDHYKPVEMQGSSYYALELEKYLGELIDPNSMSLSAEATNNPTMPCSLLSAYKSAARIYTLWISIREGNLPVPSANTPLLGEYRELLKGGTIRTQDPLIDARISAGYFVNQIFFTRAEDTRLISASTQAECLVEFINPTY